MDKEALAAAVGKRIVETRKARFTQTELSSALGLAPKTLGFYERGERALPFEVACQISELFGVSLDWIATGRDSRLNQKLLTEAIAEILPVMAAAPDTKPVHLAVLIAAGYEVRVNQLDIGSPFVPDARHTGVAGNDDSGVDPTHTRTAPRARLPRSA